MINYTLFFNQNRIHDNWHTRLNNIEQVRFYHRDLSCPHCYPAGQNTDQFVHFWNWFSTENPAASYTINTQQAFEDLINSISITETWEAIYLIVFSI
jgi:hypothetical protein